MKSIWFMLAACLVIAPASSRAVADRSPASMLEHVAQHGTVGVGAEKDSRADIIFLGDSITAGADWARFFPKLHVKNRGISGDTTLDILRRLHELYALDASKLFLLVGINDLNANTGLENIVERYRIILQRLTQNLPKTEIYVQSVLPVRNRWFPYQNQSIQTLNEHLRRLAREFDLKYVDLYPAFIDSDGQLEQALSDDGLHLLPAGYQRWVKRIRPLAEQKPGE